ncbi:ubiquitin-like small modifier protein 1 [Halopelagius fulvigenes]|uniref:Ubiquitin-like small modifier protein 1 n=1 Tax=Halopelagius fulvigenes TaxID=1198324 RepID=A0ABD5TYR0_9EURY
MRWKMFADLAEAAGDRTTDVRVSSDATVRDALDALLDDRDGLGDRVLDEDGQLKEHVNLLRNGSAAEFSDPVADGDELALFPPVSGG